MNLRRVLGLLCLWMTLWMIPGWANDLLAGDEQEKASAATAAKDEGKVQEKGEAKEEEKPGSKEEAKKEECPSTFGPIITDTAIPLEKGKLAIQPTFGLGLTTNNFTQSWRRVNAGGDFQSFNMSWKFTYGLINNLEVYTVIPYIHNWAGNVDLPGPNNERFASFGGLGDISLTFKYRLVEETETLPTVSAYFTPTFPSGHFNHLNPGLLGTDLIGGGSYVFTPGLNLSKYIKPFIFYGNFWYSMQTAHDSSDNGRQFPRDFATINLAAEYLITEKWIACLEMVSHYDGGRMIGHQSNVMPGALISVAPELEYMVSDKFALAFGVNCDLAGKNNAGNITPLLSCMYQF